jgi:PAS domain S-box-containing protein
MAAQIHERENELRESKKRYEELANLLPETVYETDTAGRFTFMSRSGFAAFGLTEEDLDAGLSVLDLFVEEDRGRIREDMERIKAGEPVGATEYTALRKDGTRFPVLVHSSAVVRGETGEGLRAIAVDITDRKRLEEELARLASGIAHQVRNPVMTIGGFALRLQKQYATDEDPHNWLQIILLEVQRLERMVADIHELTGLREAEPHSVSPKEVLEAFIAEFRKRPEFEGIRLRTDLPDGLSRVTVDQGLIFMAFEKIMENAVDAMPEGGELEIRAVEEGGQVCVLFSDEGVGIAEQDLPHVCEPFYGSKPQASGLGLTVVQRILLEHRGRLVIESSVERGTSVEVCLPPALPKAS